MIKIRTILTVRPGKNKEGKMESSYLSNILEDSHNLKVFFLDGGFLTCAESAKASVTHFAFAGITPSTGEAAAGNADYATVRFSPVFLIAPESLRSSGR